MSQHTKVSIITPSFNQAEYIESTIRSVFDQHIDSDIEYIVMDGGSTDETKEILSRYDDRITWFSNKDKGQSDALNKGIAIAEGEIIGWLNSDDVYLPGALKKVIDYFKANPECQWLYGKCKIIDEKDRETRKWITSYKNLFLDKFSLNMLLVENFISQPAVFFKKNTFTDVGKLNNEFNFAMDYDLWIRFARNNKPGFINDYLACFRVHGNAKSRLNSRKQFMEQYYIHKKNDNRKLWLFLHLVNIYKTIAGYWVIEKISRLIGK